MSDPAETFDALFAHLVAARALGNLSSDEEKALISELNDLWWELTDREKRIRGVGMFGEILAMRGK